MEKNEKHHIRQHFIPQCYLKNFSENGEKLFTFDKIQNKSYVSSINRICCIDDFYTLPEGSIDKYTDERKNQLYIEYDFFAKEIEPKYSKLLQKIIKGKDDWIKKKNNSTLFSVEEKFEFAYYLALQWYRTPYMRHNLVELSQKNMPKLLSIFTEIVSLIENDSTYNELDIHYKLEEKSSHANLFYDNPKIIEMANLLMNNYWEFSVSKKNNIYTSDFPITVKSHVENIRPIFLGLLSFSSELTFPISKNIVLTIWDRNYFTSKGDNDCKFNLMADKEIKRKNLFTYFYAKRHVFCCLNEFSHFVL